VASTGSNFLCEVNQGVTAHLTATREKDNLLHQDLLGNRINGQIYNQALQIYRGHACGSFS